MGKLLPNIRHQPHDQFQGVQLVLCHETHQASSVPASRQWFVGPKKMRAQANTGLVYEANVLSRGPRNPSSSSTRESKLLLYAGVPLSEQALSWGHIWTSTVVSKRMLLTVAPQSPSPGPGHPYTKHTRGSTRPVKGHPKGQAQHSRPFITSWL